MVFVGVLGISGEREGFYVCNTIRYTNLVNRVLKLFEGSPVSGGFAGMLGISGVKGG